MRVNTIMAPPKNNVRQIRGKRKAQFVKKQQFTRTEKAVVALAAKRALNKVKVNKNELESNTPVFRRIVNITTLGSDLRCNTCNLNLSLLDMVFEKQQGLASVLTIKCTSYNQLHFVHTDKCNIDSNNRSYEINKKIAFEAIDAAIGLSHFNKVLTNIDIPSMNSKTFKKYERKVGVVIEEVAKESCVSALKLERKVFDLRSSTK